MQKHVILDQVFPARSRAVVALRNAGPGDANALQASVQSANETAQAFGRALAASRWKTFAEALEIARLVTEWERGVLAAEIDSDRFLRAARIRLEQLRAEPPADEYSTRLVDLLTVINGDLNGGKIRALRHDLAAVPMPLAVFADPEPKVPSWPDRTAKDAKAPRGELSVAFVEFRIDGTTVERVQSLRPNETHDLDIAVRVSRWPDGATSLVLSPISIDPPTSYDLPVFELSRPTGEPPFLFEKRGRMLLHVPQSLKARPFEFMYAAEFRPAASEQPVSIAGQRTLRLSGVAADAKSITGYPGIDKKLLEFRDRLRVEPLVPEQDLDDLLKVLIPISNLLGQAVQDARFPTVISEKEFQKHVREFLRQHPDIGAALEEQAQSAGGRTDLSYKGIRIELKCESDKRLLPEDCKRYAAQPASYAVGTNRRVAILCVLDCSPKKEAAFPAEDGLYVYPLDTGSSPVYIATCLIQGNLAKPSSLVR